MSLSSATLSAIQQAGAAVFAADAELKNAGKDYAERVTAAMGANPYGLGNDALFENWKLVARLSQTMAGIEEELKKVYRVASELIADDDPALREVPALAAPTRAVEQGVSRQDDMTPTDVVAKTKKKSSKPTPRASKARPSPVKPAGTIRNQLQLRGNAVKLLQYFERVLNPNEFTAMSQTTVGRETGIPLGSMTAAIKKLVESDRIIAGPTGSFRLAKLP